MFELKAAVHDLHKDFSLMDHLEDAFHKRDEDFFIEVLSKPQTLWVRIHAICMLAEIGTDECIPVLAKVLGEDGSPLARHEVAFTMGQLGLKSAVPALLSAVQTDHSAIVRHESASALGAIADQTARQTLEDALKDLDEDVRMTALVALADLDYARSLAERHGFSL